MSEQDQWPHLPTAVVEQGRNRTFRPALAVSVLLHCGFLLGLTLKTLPGRDLVPSPASTQALTLVAVSSNPQRRPAVIPDVSDALAPPPAQELPAPPASIPVEVEVPAEDRGVASTAPASDEAEPAAPGLAPLNRAVLQTMISTIVRSGEGKMLEQWLEECERYRNRYQTADCPQGEEAKTARQDAIESSMAATFSTWVTGHDRNERIAEELLDDMETLRPLVESGGLLGTLAAERYALKREQFLYLDPPEKGLAFGGEGLLPVLAFTPTSFVLLGGLLSLDTKNGFRVMKAPDPGPAKSFSETEAVHRAPEQAPGAVPQFEVQPSLWPVAR